VPPRLPLATAPLALAPPTPDERTQAMLCHLLALFTGVIGPLVLWLVKRDQSRFIDDQGKESLNFQLTLLTIVFGAGLVGVPLLFFGGFLILMLMFPLLIASKVFEIMACVAANNGVAYRYPLNFRFLR
jgi:uncharacterized Tic20 family protein